MTEKDRPSRLGLDWDETVTEFPAGFRRLSRAFDEVFIITLNRGVSHRVARELLGHNVKGILYCPDEAVVSGMSHVWKAMACVKLGVDLMFDDDPDVTRECGQKGIAAIGVGTHGDSLNSE